MLLNRKGGTPLSCVIRPSRDASRRRVVWSRSPGGKAWTRVPPQSTALRHQSAAKAGLEESRGREASGRCPQAPGDALRIGVVSPPMLPIPPARYAGTERIVAALVDGLHRRGHHVTLFAPGDSQVDCDLVPTVPRSLWSTGYRGDLGAYMNITMAKAWSCRRGFDVIHSHLDTIGLPFARWCPTPVVSTLHGRLDGLGHPALLDEFCDVPLVAISESQRRWSPQANWVATIHHGLDLAGAPFGGTSGDLPRVRRAHRAREGCGRRDRSGASRPAWSCVWVPRCTTNESATYSTRSSRRPSTRAWSSSWARSDPESATSCTPGPWPR